MQPFSAALREIATIPGARYSCVADEAGDVLAEHGAAGPDPAAAVRWGSGLHVALRASGELEDMVITGERTYHLLRRVRAAGRSLLVHVSVDRSVGNLAVARRALGRLDLTSYVPGVRSPAVIPAVGRLERRPVRTARRPGAIPAPRAPESAVRSAGAPPSAVAPPRRDSSTPPGRQARDAPATPRAATSQAGGWSDDLATMQRLLDALRRMP